MSKHHLEALATRGRRAPSGLTRISLHALNLGRVMAKRHKVPLVALVSLGLENLAAELAAPVPARAEAEAERRRTKRSIRR